MLKTGNIQGRMMIKIVKKFINSGLIWLWISLLVICIDRYSKVWMLDHLTYQEPVRIFPFFNLTLTFNSGAAFSFLHNASGWQNWFLGGLALLVSLFVLFWLSKQSAKNAWFNIALCLVLGGALGNALDRVLNGYVIDFISLHLGTWYFAIFNLADSAISIGAVMIFLHWTFSKNN